MTAQIPLSLKAPSASGLYSFLCAVLVLVGLIAPPSSAADSPNPPGMMLRPGSYAGVGSYVLPEHFAKIQPAKWPTQGWHRLRFVGDKVEITAAAPAPQQHMPSFLIPIAAQVHRMQFDSGEFTAEVLNPPQDGGGALYVNIPHVQFRTGTVAAYRFKNGSATITPILDHRYNLSLKGQSFAVTVRNGFRTKDGKAYGEGAQYTIEYDGQKYEYSLGQHGWDSRIVAITDIDGDGKPDFFIGVGGNNSSSEYVLLSSKAKPGRNVPTASLSTIGC